MNMKSQIALVLLLASNGPIFAVNDKLGNEEYELLSKDVKTESVPKKEKKLEVDCNKCCQDVHKVGVGAFWGVLFTSVAALGLSELTSSPCPEAPAPAAPSVLPQCNIALVNRFDAHCLTSLQPSHGWTVIKSQLTAMEQLSNVSCVPGCTYHLDNEQRRRPSVLIGNEFGEELLGWVIDYNEFSRELNEYGTREFQYAVCPKQGSVIGRIKSYFKTKGIPLWGIPTEDENMEGFFFRAKESDVVIDAEAYEQVVNDAEVWRTIMQGQQEDGVKCTGQAFE